MPANQFPSQLFTPGRACAGPLAVVLHEYLSGIEMLDADMAQCPRRRPLQSPGCHTSYHAGISGCSFHQYIQYSDTAWGFGPNNTQPACPPPLCPPEPCEECTGLTADQYQTDFDGNPPVLPAFVAGPDGTVNCGVVHIAVSNLYPTRLNGICCDPAPVAYKCLVEALAEVFTAIGLVPSQTTLLVHCGELDCLDIDLLVTDIIEEQNQPAPVVIPCNCAPTAAQLCQSIGDLPVGDPAEYGVTAVIGTDCETHVLPAIPPPTNVVAGDTTTVNNTVVQAPAGTFTVSSDVNISPTAGNQLTVGLGGLYVPEVTVVGSQTITALTSVTESPSNTFTVSVDVELPNILAQIDTCSGPYSQGETLLADAAAVPLATPTTNTTSIWASGSEEVCPSPLAASTYSEFLQRLPVVLGGDGISTSPVWGLPDRAALDVNTFTDISGPISPDTGDVFRYIGVPFYVVDLDPPTGFKNDLYVKNSSANNLSVLPSSGQIDGSPSLALATNESAHLVWDGTNWYKI